ncbi:MAG: methylated-DNA--[protein]-cysteine S-methyltransferase [Lachnospiraceae bacterium]|nr:methylated-DNA--[protein]-cysteine S-methyltransferase [Lachnospiraceae bacterium]
MNYISEYKSPLGNILIAADDIGLTGARLEGQNYFDLDLRNRKEDLAVFKETKRWLDIYFSGKEPDFKLPLHLSGSDFQMEVWNILCEIPYGEVTTYGEIAKQLTKKRGIKRMSAQAVGGAVGHNKISIIIPCHRVIGANGKLVGYGGGIDKKIALLKLEHIKLLT